MKKISVLFIVLCFLALGLAGCGDTGTAKSEKASFHASNSYDGDLSGVTLDIGAAGIQNAQGVLQAAGLDDTPYTVHLPPIFASLSNNGGNFKIVASRYTKRINLGSGTDYGPEKQSIYPYSRRPERGKSSLCQIYDSPVFPF